MALSAARRAHRRQHILEQARALYAERGVEGTRMEDIAKAAGVTRRTLYAYFHSNDDLCLHVGIEDMRRRRAVQTAAMDAVDGALAKLRTYGESYFAFAGENPHSLHLQFYWDYRGIRGGRMSEEGLRRLDEAVEPIVSRMRGIFLDGQREGVLRAELDADATLAQYAYTLRAVLNRALFPGHSFARIEPDSFVKAFLDLFLRGIAARPKELP